MTFIIPTLLPRFTQNCSFIGNRADIGPAVYVGNFSEVTIFDSSIVINNTKYRLGQDNI